MAAQPQDLATLARVKNSIQQITDSSQDTRLQLLLTAASEAISNYLRRDIYSRTYDEIQPANPDNPIVLANYPLQSITSVRHSPETVLQITNTDTATNQQARVQITSTGLTLTRKASSTLTTNSITYAGQATFQSLTTAITALGAGWTALTAPGFTLWPTADLYVPPAPHGDGLTSAGNFNARGVSAKLQLHTQELTQYRTDPRGYLFPAADSSWPFTPDTCRIIYTAGFTAIPEAIQEATSTLTAELYWLTLRDPAASSTSIPGQISNQYRPPLTASMNRLASLLAPFKKHL